MSDPCKSPPAVTATSATERPMLNLFGPSDSVASNPTVSHGFSTVSVPQPVDAPDASGSIGALMGSVSVTKLSDAHHPTPPQGKETPTSGVPTPAVPGTMFVTDPLSRKLAVPCDAIRPTQATTRPGVPSLCLLFLDGRCRQGVQCHQIHAEPAVVLRLREGAKAMPTCCQTHGDIHSARMRPEWLKRSLQFDHVSVPVTALAYSNALERLLTSDPSLSVRCTTQQLCRLHGSERCRFTEDCRFLHLCRQVLRQQFAESVPDLIPQLETRHKSRHSPGSSIGGGSNNTPMSVVGLMQHSPGSHQRGGTPMQSHGGHPQHHPQAAHQQVQMQPGGPQLVMLPDGRLAQVLPQVSPSQAQGLPLQQSPAPPYSASPSQSHQQLQQHPHVQGMFVHNTSAPPPQPMVFQQVPGPQQPQGILAHPPQQQQQQHHQQQPGIWLAHPNGSHAAASMPSASSSSSMPSAWQ